MDQWFMYSSGLRLYRSQKLIGRNKDTFYSWGDEST